LVFDADILFADLMARHRGAAIVAACVLMTGWGVVPAPGEVRFRVDKPISVLPSSAVLSLAQTRDGYLWVGTLKGLARFDGERLEQFRDAAAPALEGDTIGRIFEDSRRNLWVGTENGGVMLIAPNGQVKSLEIGRRGREGQLAAAVEDKKGGVWLFSADGNLCRYRDREVDVWSGFQAQSDCRTLGLDDAGMLWVATDGGLSVVDPSAAVARQPLPSSAVKNLPAARVNYALASRRGGFWVLADGHVRRWAQNRVAEDLGVFPWLNSTVTNQPYLVITAACEDLDGNLVIGTYGNGIYWYDSAGHAALLSSKSGGLTHDSILALMMDREGSLWVGTNGGGLNRIKRLVFNDVPQAQGKTVQSVCEGQDGEIWIGYNGGARVDRWNGTAGEPFQLVHLGPGEQVEAKAVFVDSNQRVWAGAWGGGGPWLFQFEAGHFLPLAGPELTSREVSAFFQDSHGTMWFGMHGGLGRLDQHGWKLLTTRDGLASDEVRAITEDRDHNLWIGTSGGGLSRLVDGKFSNFSITNGLPSDDVSSLLADAQGILWAGTGGGLGRFDGNRWTRITRQQGLASDSLSYMVEDGQGNLWIGSNAGLMRVRKQALNDLATGTNSYVLCRVYGEVDGLPADECTFGSQPGAWRARSGKLYFPTVHGLGWVDPGQLRQNTNPPPVLVEAVFVAGQPQSTNNLRAPQPRVVTLRPGQEGLQIQFASLNLAAPDKGRIKYRLDPYEKWIERPGNVREALYGKLPQGKYQFQVTACNEDGEWNTEGASIGVVVLPPFWKTWWFLGALSAALLGAVGGAVHYVSTQRLQRQLAGLRQQEALERERARIARDLHDQLGANLTQVSLLGELAASDSHSPGDVETHARQISQTARETTLALDEIVWTVNPSNDTLDSLITYVCKYAQEYFRVAGLRYRLEVPPQLPATGISPELRHNVFLAAKEAINNVVKHSRATAAWFRLKLDRESFVIEIEDNGQGIDSAKTRTGRNGLVNMRKRMDDIRGSFDIGPGAEGGTRVSLAAPLGNGHKSVSAPRPNPPGKENE
jgi:ligand-binding sensor domain-containing protein/signal transduction histidine kinase